MAVVGKAMIKPIVTLKFAHYIKIEMTNNNYGTLTTFNFTFWPGQTNEKSFIIELPPKVSHDLCNFMGKLKHFVEREPDE